MPSLMMIFLLMMLPALSLLAVSMVVGFLERDADNHQDKSDISITA